MKKLNKKGFTLIELLAVVVIMGILMLVAIPAIQRIIENTRRDTFADTAKNYVNAARTMWLADSFSCRTSDATADTLANLGNYTLSSSLGNGDYYILIESSKQGTTESGQPSDASFKPYPLLLQQGGKSSWSNKGVTGIIKVTVSGYGTSDLKQSFSIAMNDGTHGIISLTDVDSIKRASVATSGANTIKNGETAITADTKTVVAHLCQEEN